MMSGNPSDRMLLAALLPAEERGEWLSGITADEAGLLAIDRLDRMLEVSGVRVDPSDEAMEVLLAHRAGLKPSERAAFDGMVSDLASRLPDPGSLVARWRESCARMAALDAALPAAAHFERLAGQTVAPGRTAESARVMRLWPIRRWAAAAVVVTLVAAGAVGRATEDDDARAAWESIEARRASRTRGPSTEAMFSEWIAEAYRARSHRLGLWPVYDRAKLEELERTVLDSEEGSARSLLLLGEIRLMRGERDAGLVALRAAASSGNEEARVLLQRVE